MSELKKTLSFAGGALVLALLAAATAPRAVRPDAFSDVGEPFFPEFQDPNAAASLEVVEYDADTGSADAFKVVNDGGRWTIPSHHDYPADGEDRLARTAAGVIGIRKDDFRSDNTADHEALGVVDPLDETAAGLAGRGKRVTLRGGGGEVLADFIVGAQPEGRTGYRFVRIPGQKRVYAAEMDVDLSTRFDDWIEKDLLQVGRDEIARVVVMDYSIDERSGRLDQRDVLSLEREGSTWKADGMRANQQVDSSKLNTLLSALDNLNIVGIRPKPSGLSATLSRTEATPITQSDVRSLQSRGYYFTRDGRLVSNEGEVRAVTGDGVEYTLRFGELVYGSGEALTAGTGADPAVEEAERGTGENRYLFITADFDPESLPEPESGSEAHTEWEEKLKAAREKADRLNARFADWYYVIPAQSFENLRVSRREVVVAKES
jgi:hypothetical protein